MSCDQGNYHECHACHGRCHSDDRDCTPRRTKNGCTEIITCEGDQRSRVHQHVYIDANAVPCTPATGSAVCPVPPPERCPEREETPLEQLLRWLAVAVSIFLALLIIIAISWVIVSSPYGTYVSAKGEKYRHYLSTLIPVIVAPEGGPCKRWDEDYCVEAEKTEDAVQFSRFYLKLGDAQSSVGELDDSRRFYRLSMEVGKNAGAQAAIHAAKRIQYQSMTCEYDRKSLARISRGFENNQMGGLIEFQQKQDALEALGYYLAGVDNVTGVHTREAVRDFQGDLWFEQTGALSAEQTTLLMCAGAQIAQDVSSQNVLGIMYATGLGVRQNTDYSLHWLESAARRGSADAQWNLALMYGTQTVFSSIHVCDAVQNAERADSYLRAAVKGGHPAAVAAQAKYPGDTPEQRWVKLNGDLNKPAALLRVGHGCNPNP